MCLALVEDTFGSNNMRERYPYQPVYSRWNNNPVFTKQNQEVNYREPYQYNREQRPSGYQNYQRDQYYSYNLKPRFQSRFDNRNSGSRSYRFEGNRFPREQYSYQRPMNQQQNRYNRNDYVSDQQTRFNRQYNQNYRNNYQAQSAINNQKRNIQEYPVKTNENIPQLNLKKLRFGGSMYPPERKNLMTKLIEWLNEQEIDNYYDGIDNYLNLEIDKAEEEEQDLNRPFT